ncbi:unnamed protein product [Somion occarium]|uniref:Aminotransferase class I/classII large domain-containing protein n=1 Tax=Somion occarium TaxID=3059160 RepID=A0ABP1CWW9_9APHY
MALEKHGKAIDLSHHLSDLSRARGTSPLKGLIKYVTKPGTISLAGGMPHPSYFPYADISANALASDNFALEPTRPDSSVSWFWKLFGAGSSKEKIMPITIPKCPSQADDINLAVSLQYVYKPAYSDWTTLVQTGNTDGWSRALQTLCNPGELILTEEWTYPSALANSQPFNIFPVPIAMDSEGMRSDDLRKVLSEWDETARGGKRPHVMYTVPVGQNPSGATMGLERKKEIYDICVEFDIIIVEDDPYYFLQEGQYKPKSERSSQSAHKDPGDFIANLVPSYLKVDYQGRVIRLDTFSKTIAPGSRLGFFTCNPRFAERLERHGETTTQAPCGFGQSLITQLLKSWGYEGYTRWLHGLAVQYTGRRDYIIDCFAEEFHLRSSIGTTGIWNGLEVYDLYAKPKRNASGLEKFDFGPKLISFVPPTSGMFIWLKINFRTHPSFKEGDEEPLETQLFIKLAEGGVLVAPGWFFAATDNVLDSGEGHVRISFSNVDFDALKKAVGIFGTVLRDFFKE